METAQSYREFILKSIGNTPMIQLNSSLVASNTNLYVKCEFVNPSGSHKDRMYLFGIKKLEEQGFIKKGMTLVDFSSGNAGASLAMLAPIFGYNALIVRPRGLSPGKAALIRAYGGQIVETPPEEGIEGARKLALQIVEEMNAQAFLMYQTDRDFNIEAFNALADEIIFFFSKNQLYIDAFVCAVGTGGTLTAVARRIKEAYPRSKIVAVDIDESALLYSQFYKVSKQLRPHSVEGMSVGEIFRNTDISIIDEVELCSGENAWLTMKELHKGGFIVGPSSGACLYAAISIAEKFSQGSNILTIFWDQGWKYFFNNDKENSQ